MGGGAEAAKHTLAQRLGQSFNAAGISLFARVAYADRPLALPHLTVPDVRWVDWAALRRAGFRGAVFDKDNTLTLPYALGLHPRAAGGLAAATAAFDGAVVLYSNSAGLAQYDQQGAEAARLEAALGLPVLRHCEKKPAGGPEDMERHFGCPAHQLVMVGDRYLTDVVFGNRNGMLTVRPAPFTPAGEPTAVLLARAVEERLVARWQRQGVQPPPHPLPPVVDFGKLGRGGAAKHAALSLQNDGDAPQVVAVASCPGWLAIVDPQGQPGPWSRTEAPGSVDASTPGRSPLPGLAGQPARAGSRLASRPVQPPGSGSKLPGPKTVAGVHAAWMDKQERALCAWANSILLPVAERQDQLSARRLTARVRGLLWRTYSQDKDLISLMVRVEQRIDAGYLRLRDEEGSLKNLKEQARVKAALMAYHPFWLRLGFELVVGRAVAGGDSPVSGADLDAFAREHFMRDPSLARAHVPRGSNGIYPSAYWAELGRLVLKRFLLLVALLDRVASLPALPTGTPLLFRPNSRLKSSADMLVELLQGRLAGEGDVLRSLGRLGFRVTHYQQPRQELDFTVRNLAVDLRDGLRLCKLIDGLAARGLFDSARFPADKRPVRLHNVGLALAEAQRAGLSLEAIPLQHRGVVTLQPADVVDGDRELTLALLGRLALRFQLPALVDRQAVRVELDRLRAKAGAGDGAAAGSGASWPRGGGLASSSDAGAAAEHLAVLLEWAGAVGRLYGVGDASDSVVDGSLFCFLIHCYLGPSLMPLEDVYTANIPAEQQASGYAAADACGGSASSAGSGEEECGLEDCAWEAAIDAGPHAAGRSTAALARHRQGCQRNFALVEQAAANLGVPPILASDDWVGQGPDEKAATLFLAFLCQRLLEMSKEERAAMVIQRLWRRRAGSRPRSMREHLHAWVTAAGTVQRAARAWLLRRRLRLLAARRRQQVHEQQRLAATSLQAAWRGRQARLLVLHTLVVPRLLQQGLQQRQELAARRRSAQMVRAAAVVQARWLCRAQRRAWLQQRAAAVVIQAAVRRRQAQARFQELRVAALALQRRKQEAAAVALQAAWRAHAARQTFRQLRAAAVVVQAAVRAWRAQQLLRQHQAAQRAQTAWRAWAARRAFLQQRAAAVALQAAWRCHAARAAFLRQRRAAIVLQASARGRAARACFLRYRQAAVAIQASWRGYAVRHLLARATAATILQRHVRGWLARRQAARQKQAAVTIQRAVRAHQERKRVAAILRMRQQMAQLARTLALYQRRTAAALRIQVSAGLSWRGKLRLTLPRIPAQAAFHGWRARNEAARLRAELLARQRQREAREAAARAVIAPWAAAFCARCRLLRARRAAITLQRWWRREFARRQAAAVRIQAAARQLLAQRQLERSRAAATAIQAAWRGHHARATQPKRKKLAEARKRLAAAWAAAPGLSHRSLGARATAALQGLLAARAPAAVPAATVEALALCTEASRGCCDLVVHGGGVPALLDLVQAVHRSKQQWTSCGGHWRCWPTEHAGAVFAESGVLALLGDVMQLQREREDAFLAAARVAQRLVADPGRALAVARQPDVLSKLEGVARLLALKQAGERSYGSDASARTATRNLVAVTHQLTALNKVLAAIGAGCPAGHPASIQELDIGRNTLSSIGRNTLVTFSLCLSSIDLCSHPPVHFAAPSLIAITDQALDHHLLCVTCPIGAAAIMDPLVLRCELRGHESDVRALSPISDTSLLTASRDKTAKLWTAGEDGAFSVESTLVGHSDFVTAVAYVAPGVCEAFPRGAVVTGSRDASVIVWDLETAAPAQRLTGHEYQVTAVVVDPRTGDIYSGSLDKTIRQLPNGDVVSGSGDCTIRVWRDGACAATIRAHGDSVRGLALLGDVGVVSASHDQTLKVWTFSGEPIAELVGHTALVYCAATAAGEGLIASGSEDNTVRLWHADGTCLQVRGGAEDGRTIEHPGNVWAVAFLPNGDLLTGCSDGVARLWTRAAERAAPANAQKAYEEGLAARKAAVGGAAPGADGSGAGGSLPAGLTLEDATVLLRPGSRDGQTKVMWDFVFDVDIAEGAAPRKLALNAGDNPYDAADAFLINEGLPTTYREQIVQFILQNTGGRVSAPPIGLNPDPYTGGGAYVPGAGSSDFPSGGASYGDSADPYTGSGAYVPGSSSGGEQWRRGGAATTAPQLRHVPARTYLVYDQVPSRDAIRKKIVEFSEAVAAGGGAALGEGQLAAGGALDGLLDAAAAAARPGTAFGGPELAALSAMLAWPPAQLFPALDLARLALLNEAAAAALAAAAGPLAPTGGDVAGGGLGAALAAAAAPPAQPANQQTAARLACNAFVQPAARSWALAQVPALVDCLAGFLQAPAVGKNALATLLLNLSVALAQGSAGYSADLVSRLVSLAVELINGAGEDEAEARFRGLVGVGTLASKDAAVKQLAKELGVAQLAAALRQADGGGGKVAEAAADIAALLA
eukprot:scaffold2.g6848.t1